MTEVANFDVAGVVDRIARFAEEIIRCQSSSQAEFNEHDRSRATAYLERIEAYLGVVAEPANPMDLPKTHPTAYPVADFPVDTRINEIENAEVRDLARRFKAGYVELIGSQSKDRASGIFAPDLARVLALVENSKGLIAFGETAVDLPENPNDVPAVKKK